MSDSPDVRELLSLVESLTQNAEPMTAAQLNTALTPNLVRAEALRLQQRAADLLDEADRLEFKASLREAALSLDAPFEAALQHEERLVEAVKTAIQLERVAEDDAREAAENQRLAAEAEREGQQRRLSPAEQTDLLARSRAAADVAARFQATAEGARAQRESVERQLASARQDVKRHEAASQAASLLAKNPGKAPISSITALTDGIRRLMWGLPLDTDARNVVSEMVLSAASTLGLVNQIRAKAATERERELADVAFERNMPHKGHQLRPSNPTSPVFAVRPPTG